MIKYFLLLLLIFLSTNILNSKGNWNKTKGGPYGGTVSCITISKLNQDIFIGTQTGGIYYSNDNGNSWLERNNGLPKAQYSNQIPIVKSIAIIKDSIIYAGFDNYGNNLNGLFISTNYGDTWEKSKIMYFNESIINSIFVFNDIIFISTGDGYYDKSAGLYKSTDNGKTFQKITSGVFSNDSSVLGIVIKEGGQIYAYGNEGLIKSTDEGNNWSFLVRQEVSSLAFSDNGNLFIGSFRSVYISKDNGETFSKIVSGLPDWFYVNTILCLKNNETLIGISGTIGGNACGIFKLRTNNNKWEQVNYGLSDDPQIHILSTNINGDIFACGETFSSGVYKSTDNGESWNEFNNGLSNVYITSMTKTSEYFYVGSKDACIYKSNNFNNIWEKNYKGIQQSWGGEIFSLSSNKNGIIIAGNSSGVYTSSDNGVNWNLCYNGFPNDASQITATYSAPNGDFYAGSCENGISRINALYKSSDNGFTWSELYRIQSCIESIIITNNNNIFIGDGGLYYSSDNGASWNSLINLPSMYNIKMGINNNDILYIGSDNYDGLFRSSNNGKSWIKIINGLPETFQINCILSPTENEVLIGLEDGRIYYSSDMGNSWTNYSEGLPGVAITSLFYDKDNGVVLAGTKGNSLYYNPDIITSILEENNIINQILNLPYNQVIDCIIYDIMGRKLLEKKITFNGNLNDIYQNNNLDNGLYHCLIKTNNYHKILKFIVIR